MAETQADLPDRPTRLQSVLSRLRGLCAATEPDPRDFSPPLLRVQETAPHPMKFVALRALLGMLGLLLLWSLLGRLDIVAVAEGKLIPLSYLKIVQPAEAGVVKEILVREGQSVKAGQVLMRMDALSTEADGDSITAELARKRLTLRRIDAELAGKPLRGEPGDPPALLAEMQAQYQANRAAVAAALGEERAHLLKAQGEQAAAERVRDKLEATLPHYRDQDRAYEKLAKDGFAGPLMASDKRRERIEKEEDLKTQRSLIDSAHASIVQSERKLAQIESDARRQLYTERNEAQGAVEKLAQELRKQQHRREQLELKAPQDGLVKDLATHTAGTVVQPGTVMLTLVPENEVLRAEVWIANEDVGFVRPGQAVKVKLLAFPFQKYGMLDGVVEHVGADSQDAEQQQGTGAPVDKKTKPYSYRALVSLRTTQLEADGERFVLGAGMQASAEILLGDRTIMEYLLSPVRKAFHEAARER